MNKKVLSKGDVFQLKSKSNSLVEIVKVEDSLARVLEYSEIGKEDVTIDVSDLKEIPLSIPILISLGFVEQEGKLMGLPYEHYWLKLVNGYPLCIIDDGGTLKLATIDANAFHGMKFLPAPHLHELQNIIGSVDVAKLYEAIYQ